MFQIILSQSKSTIFSGPLFPVFIRFTLPSTLGLLALTTASLVDGFFVGHYVGPDALASVNLLIPLLTFYFALALMLAIGGSVKAGELVGAGQFQKAHALFSMQIACALLLSVVIGVLAWLNQEYLFRLLGAPESLWSNLRPYFSLLLLGLPFQFCAVVLYYFLRAADQPRLASRGLILGAASNILLDILLVGVYDFGLRGAAWATVCAQAIQCLLLIFFAYRHSELGFSLRKLPCVLLPHALANGLSEFINEISAGLLIGAINWLVMLSLGVQGVAAYAVINYLQFAFLMVCYGFVDSLHVLVSQNRGARNFQRARHFYSLALICIFSLSLLLLAVLYFAFESIVQTFLPTFSRQELILAKDLLATIWPLYLVLGLNIASCAFLTASGRALPSAIFSSLRSLLVPLSLLLLFSLFLQWENFLLALPLAEWLIFVLLGSFVIKKVVLDTRNCNDCNNA